MKSILRPALVLLGLFTLLTGAVYPAVVTGVAQLVFPQKANGSLLVEHGRIVGSALIGQPFDDPRYFWGRPSATSRMPYDGAASTGSNLGPANPALVDAVKGRVEALRAADPQNRLPIPVDLVTTSGSGLDPHISPAAAYYQVARVARERGIAEAELRRIVSEQVEERTFGFLGEPHINVLELNRLLDSLTGTRG